MSLCHWIWLTQQIPNPAVAGELAAAFGRPERVYAANEQMLLDTGLVTPEQAHRLAVMRSLDAAQAVLRSCAEADIRPITLDDALYPERLRNIPDPPLVLYSRGAIPLFDDLLCITIVGTRHASDHSRRLAESFAAELAARGVCIVSGMAAGIDSSAHLGALRAGGLTAAVFGCGADICYPAENRKLMGEILQHGCILTEYAPGTRPSRVSFPRRNRIMAGLSSGVLVAAAPEHSGSLITAQLAAEYGRDVFVIPGGIDDREFGGANELLRMGALPVTKVTDILEEYEKLFRFDGPLSASYKLPQSPRTAIEAEEAAPGPKPVRAPVRPAAELKDEDAVPARRPEKAAKQAEGPVEPEKSAAKAVRKPEKASEKAEKPAENRESIEQTASLSSEEQLLVDALRSGCEYPDQCVLETGLPVDRVLVLLTKMEIGGAVRHLPGGRYQAL